ncbi:MAG: serine/threonine-protein kinase [Acidobacteria bacterium]|nr:serine/threonine-protein kinase [Acidobacteriota bacterium]
MSLQPGARLGPYEIVSALGAGGMGEVYRARDPRLGRNVAIKVLPTAFSADVDRLHRFEQEARAAAALNHPNILAVYDIGTHAEAPFIVSELLEGETLRERVNAGPVPVRKTIELALHIAHGLAAAHDKGITHRDLKPENLFVTRDDRVKILDFGLAKLTQNQPAFGPASGIATTPAPTQPGVVLGTVGYMAPEQVRGLPVDHRADLFAFGAILYELLSGRRAFSRDTAPETMAAILNEDPPELSAAAAPIPPALMRIVSRCLEKSPSGRFQTASDLAFALDGLSDASSVSTAARGSSHRGHRTWLAWGAAALLLAALGTLAYQRVRERPAAPSPMRFQIPPIVELAGQGNFALSPDGRHLAFFGRGSDGIVRLWIRTMDSLEVRPLPGSEAHAMTPPPFWSPDGKFVAFDAGGKLKKLDVSGGLPQTLCDLPAPAVGGSWNRHGDILVGNIVGGLLRVRETGGVASPVTALDPARKEEFHLLPTFLPDGRHFVYLRIAPGAPDNSGSYVGTLDAKPEDQSPQRLLPYQVGLTYAAAGDSGPGRLLFLREGTLMAQPFDARRLAFAGDPVPVAERVGSFRDGGFFAVSDNGVLVYRTADTDSQLAWFDRQGAISGRVSEPGGFRDAALSPDGARAVASRTNPQDTAKADLWLFDLSRGSGATRLTLGTGIAEFPLWSPDGKRIVFTFGNSVLRQKLASGEGTEQELFRSNSAGGVQATDWSPDGRFLLYTAVTSMTTTWDLWVLPGDGSKPVPFVRTQFAEDQGRFSPTGPWVAYVSNESGPSEVYVRGFSADFNSGSASTGGRVLVSRGGGTAPRWRRDGRELFYLGPDGKMMAVDVTAREEFQVGRPTPLFPIPPGAIVGDVTADGKRFLFVTPVKPSASVPFTVVLNWTTGLKK